MQLLKMKADLKPDFSGVELNSPQYMHLVFGGRETRFRGPRAVSRRPRDFYKVPVAQLTDDAYLAKRAAEVNPNAPSDTKSVLPGLGTSMPEKARNHALFGRRQVGQRGLEHLYGERLFRLGGRRGRHRHRAERRKWTTSPQSRVCPNMFGVVGSDANAIEPKKRPLSSSDADDPDEGRQGVARDRHTRAARASSRRSSR